MYRLEAGVQVLSSLSVPVQYNVLTDQSDSHSGSTRQQDTASGPRVRPAARPRQNQKLLWSCGFHPCRSTQTEWN